MIEPISALSATPLNSLTQVSVTPQNLSQGVSFEQLLHKGIEATDMKVAEANRLVATFALDDTIPAHQVTFALEEARLSLELMIQVRNKLIDGYQQIMNMQV
jgi:flagellar hook-basal body complex protein FliE